MISINKEIDDKYIVEGFSEPYSGSNTRCLVKCSVHGDGMSFEKVWNPRFSALKEGRGCPKCAIEGKELSICLRKPKQFKSSRIIYFIMFKDLHSHQFFYKIGVATKNKGVKGRFINSELKKDNIEIIKYEELYTTNIIALISEYWALIHFKEQRKYMSHILKHCKGGTECFKEDITKIISLKDITKIASRDFNNIIRDFKLTDSECKDALIEF